MIAMGKPKIRFKGYEDDWEQRKLSDIYASIGNAFVGTATPYYVESGHFYLESNNIKDGQINHNSEIFINDEFYEKQKDKWLHTGDMVMVQSGHVGHAAVIPEELDNSAAHALIMFRHPKEKIEPYFLNYQYQTNKSKKKIEEITTGNTIKHILASDMQEFVVDITNYDEQKKIGSYFQKLDHLITLHQRKCEETKSLKKYMLQKMFPENGNCVPKIRFSGFADAWEQRKLGEVAQEFKSGNSLKADEIDITGDYPVYGGNGLRGYTSTYNHDGEYALIGRQGALCGNMNYSVGKARWRPWAERGGRIATNATTFNRELLIVEKANDGKPFELHTSYDDKEKYYRNLRNPWLFLLLMFALFAVTKQSIIFGIFALVSVIPGSIYQIQIMKIRKEAKTQEW